MLLHKHGWDEYYDVDIMDSEGDIALDIENGIIIKKNYVGAHITNYDSMLVLSHFKGHPMGGYGGALKQLSIGCASRRGKAYIHGAGTTDDPDYVWQHLPEQNKFLESMADAASCVTNHFKGNIAFINVMANMSVDCDCCSVAEDPCMKDIGILASTDPVALDQACIDLVFRAQDGQSLQNRILDQNGLHILTHAEEIGLGNRAYEIINVDEK